MAYKPLKFLFDTALAERLSRKIVPVHSSFRSSVFVEEFGNAAEGLELKDRIELMCDLFDEYLIVPYPEKVGVLLKILGPENELETGMFKAYYWIMPIAKLVEKYGLDHLDVSLHAIEEITKRNTGEYAIRPYIRIHTHDTLEKMKAWSMDENFHVRRLASEGLRTRLPWATKMDLFIEDPEPIIDIIDRLKDDEVKYIQKSVANNLNDILKDNRSFGMAVLKQWSSRATPQRKWVIRHALRNLRKAGDEEALELLNTV